MIKNLRKLKVENAQVNSPNKIHSCFTHREPLLHYLKAFLQPEDQVGQQVHQVLVTQPR